jgi:hypothetical protein
MRPLPTREMMLTAAHLLCVPAPPSSLPPPPPRQSRSLSQAQWGEGDTRPAGAEEKRKPLLLSQQHAAHPPHRQATNMRIWLRRTDNGGVRWPPHLAATPLRRPQTSGCMCRQTPFIHIYSGSGTTNQLRDSEEDQVLLLLQFSHAAAGSNHPQGNDHAPLLHPPAIPAARLLCQWAVAASTRGAGSSSRGDAHQPGAQSSKQPNSRACRYWSAKRYQHQGSQHLQLTP